MFLYVFVFPDGPRQNFLTRFLPKSSKIIKIHRKDITNHENVPVGGSFFCSFMKRQSTHEEPTTTTRTRVRSCRPARPAASGEGPGADGGGAVLRPPACAPSSRSNRRRGRCPCREVQEFMTARGQTQCRTAVPPWCGSSGGDLPLPHRTDSNAVRGSFW